MSKNKSKVITENGKPLVVYHATTNDDLTEFYKRGNAGIHFGTKKAGIERREATDVDFENNYTLIPVHLKIERPLILNQDFNWEWENMDLVGDDFDIKTDTENSLFESYMHRNGYNIFDANGGLKTLEELLSENNYDGIFYKNKIEDKGSTSYLVVNPSQIKILKN
jgi:hypothetical protein